MESKDIRFDEIRVVVTDTEGNVFWREWRETADRIDAIRWTIESGDLPYALSGKIKNIEIIHGEKK